MSESSGGRAMVALLGVMVLMAVIAGVVAEDTSTAGADELATFSSCAELTTWMSDAAGGVVRRGGAIDFEETGAALDATAGDAAQESSGAPSPTSAASGAAGTGADDGTGATNVIVEGIDELDRVEQLDGERMLAVGEQSLHLVDVAAGASLASVPVPPGAQVSFDPERSQVWVAGFDGTRTQVTRLVLDGDSLSADGAWSTDGMLLTGRRSGEGFHAVVVEGFGGAVPFDGGPVDCDEVLHPAGPATPQATLIVTLPAEGAVEPTAATEIVGAGRFVHLTSDAAFIATELWEAPPATSLHRFDLATLAHTGSGRVEGTLLNEFALSLHDDHLRVAVTHGGGGMGIGGPAVDVIDVAEPEPMPMPVEPGPGDPGAPPDQPGEPLNEVVVLDTDGDLDVVGRTARFGLPGETLHGIRFAGTTAYAVTFLQTDPFYVIDLATASAPQVVGEVKLPGFSSYLHPVADGLVVGFGPDDDGTIAAKLFDVSDPAQPTVTGTVSLGQESAIAWDHHAFLGLGEGRFAVPANTWEPVEAPGCDAQRRTALEAQALALEQQISETTDQAQLDSLYRQIEAVWSDPCVNPTFRAVSSVVELEATGSGLRVVSRTEVRSDNPAERVLRSNGAWVLYSTLEVVVAGDDGSQASVRL